MSVFASMNQVVFYTFVGGISLFTIGLIWLIYLNAKMNYEYTNDGDTLAWYVTLASVMCMIGILTFAIAGLWAVSA